MITKNKENLLTEDIKHMDTRSLELLAVEIREQLLEMTRTAERSRVFDEAGDYLPEAAETAYEAALSELLNHPEDYYGSAGGRVQLRLTQDGWKIIPTRDLLNELSGNLQQE